MLLTVPGSQRRPFRRTLAGPGANTRRIRVALLDRSGDVITPLTPGFRDGQVLIDADQDVDRTVSLTILDPRHAYGFDADTYSGGILDLTRMIRVWWRIDGPLLDRPITTPVFTGPISHLEREGALLTIEGQGKEVYGLGENRRTLTIRPGARKTDAIRTILRELMGETRFDIPDLPARLPNDVVVSRKDKPWKVAQKIAESMNRQLYYDGSGTATLRPKSSKPVWTFNDGGELTSGIKVAADLTKVINHVRVIGPKPKGKKTPITSIATADKAHPLSPWKLGPSEDAPMFLTKTIENDHIRTQREADELAEDELAQGLRLVHSVDFTSVPIPVFDPLDMVRIATEHEELNHRIRTLTLPLGLGGGMTIGSRSTYGLKARHGHRRRHGSGRVS